jgi:hypothetical protein
MGASFDMAFAHFGRNRDTHAWVNGRYMYPENVDSRVGSSRALRSIYRLSYTNSCGQPCGLVFFFVAAITRKSAEMASSAVLSSGINRFSSPELPLLADEWTVRVGVAGRLTCLPTYSVSCCDSIAMYGDIYIHRKTWAVCLLSVY